MVQPILPNGGRNGGGFNPPSGGGSPSGKGPISIQLVTSTGGLLGTFGALMVPVVSVDGTSLILTYDSTNFDCEEDAEYDFRQEAQFIQGQPYEGRSISIHQIVLKYRELGKASFSINITVFNQKLDDFVTIQIPVSIPQIAKSNMTRSRMRSFPDGRIHTIKIAPPNGVIQGERPQVTITRKANSGPFSITKLTLCGNADEMAQQ